MERVLKIGKMTWFHCSNPSKKELDEIKNTYDLHEIIEEDISEVNTQDKVDVYDNSIFLVLHFPKFQNNWTYASNEFNIILWKDFIISLTTYSTNHIEEIRSDYIESLKNWKEEFRTSPYYILYTMIDVMYDKVLQALTKFKWDLTHIEKKVFSEWNMDQSLIRTLTIKKRNAINLKHIMTPQEEILAELWKLLKELYHGDLDVYFEDLEYKHDKIMSNIAIVTESTDTLSDSYNSLMTIKTNHMVSVLTIVTVIIWIMTFLTWLYGMNVDLPGQQFTYTFLILIWIMAFVAGLMLIFFRKRDWL